MLRMTAQHQQTLYHHAQQVYPEECCGILIGVVADDGVARSLLKVIPTRNAWDAIAADEMAERIDPPTNAESGTEFERSRRYWIDPKDLFDAQRHARHLSHPDGQPDIIGFYHSHPDHPAIPSECDRACAWSVYSYIIMSVRQGIPSDLLSWRLDEQQRFQPEPIRMVDSSGAVMDCDRG